MSWQRRVRWAAVWAIWAGSATWLGSAPKQAETILIVNSDASVAKYALAQASFKQTVRRPTREVDLGAANVTEDTVRGLIETLNPEIVYCIGSKAYVTATGIARTRTMVVSSALNWQRLPMAGPTYGIANELPPAAQFTTIRFFFPRLRRVGVLYSREFNDEFIKQAQNDARSAGVQLVAKAVRRPQDLARDLEDLLPSVDSLWLIPDPIVLSDVNAIDTIFGQSDAANTPVIAYDGAFAQRGAVLAMAPDVATIGGQAAWLAADVLAGRARRGIFQNPAGSEITLNLRAVQKYGLELNKDALGSVNVIIQTP